LLQQITGFRFRLTNHSSDSSGFDCEHTIKHSQTTVSFSFIINKNINYNYSLSNVKLNSILFYLFYNLFKGCFWLKSKYNKKNIILLFQDHFQNYSKDIHISSEYDRFLRKGRFWFKPINLLSPIKAGRSPYDRYCIDAT
jgi:hypothetical protein